MNPVKTVTTAATLCLCLCVAIPSADADPDRNELLIPPESVAPPRSTLFSAYNELNSLIRDGLIARSAARRELPARLAEIREDYYRRGGRDYSAKQWIFPVAGYDAGAIDRGRSHGFVPNGYDFYSGNRHGGHPAYDIFIHDRNQDSRDDRNGTAVPVLSMTGGVIVALQKGWQQGSGLRGGNYLWVYDPGGGLLVYYAHNEELFVELGTVVKPGDLLATVGRSGLNAAKRRSPTHLHFSLLRLENGQPVPAPVYRDLQRAGGVTVTPAVQ